MKKELTLREIQSVEKDILRTFDELCNKEGLRYYLYYGSLIGAIRHSGFIPWDDDIDVLMPRPDFEKLVHFFSKNSIPNHKFEHYSSDKRFIYPIARFCDCRYEIDYQGLQGASDGLFIDIYPIDGAGSSLRKAKRKQNFSKHFTKLIAFAGHKKYKRSSKGFFVDVCKFIAFHIAQVIPLNIMIKTWDNYLKKTNYETSMYVANIIWPTYGLKEICKIDDFNKIEMIEFEDITVRSPYNPQKHLSRIYGDFMKLPAEEDRVSHHYYSAYRKNH